MYKFLEDTFAAFRSCFSNRRAYHWFVILVTGFMFRDDTLGVTSVIRTLMLDGSCYETMLHFFYSKAWHLDGLRQTWYSIVFSSGHVQRANGKYVLVGDGVKTPKEAVRMPGVKKHFQESEDSSKGEYIHGHMFGAIGAVIDKGADSFCVPLRMGIQEGLAEASAWEGSEISGESHVRQMIRDGFQAADRAGDCILLLDRLFLTTQAIRLVDELNGSGDHGRLDIVTKARRNCTAFEEPPPRPAGKRGAPRKKGDPVRLSKLFSDEASFTEASAKIYGQTKKVKYRSRDLLWGVGLYRKLRFVLVTYDGTKSILTSTDLGLAPVQIIELYSKRFRIENCFREFKQQLGGFGYHFWTAVLEKLNHFKKKEEPDNLSKVTKRDDRNKVLGKVRAIECFVQLCCIAMGMLQLISFLDEEESGMTNIRYTRTRRRTTFSEAAVMHYLRHNFFALMASNADSPITRIIRAAQSWKKRQKTAV